MATGDGQTPAPANGNESMAQAVMALIAQQGGTGNAQEPRPWVGGISTPKNRYEGWKITSGQPGWTGRGAFSDHQNQFIDKFNSDAAWRTQLVTYAIGSGIAGMNKNSGKDDFMKVWDYAGELSSKWADNGRKMTPMQVLQFLAGGKGKGLKVGPDGVVSGGGSGSGGSVSHSTSTNTSYDISNADTAKALTNSVMAAALGREATPVELAQYRAALNAAERANPGHSSSSSSTRSDGSGNSSSTSSGTSYSGGLDGSGKAQVLLDKARGTAEGQAYQTNDVFNKAIQYLAGQ